MEFINEENKITILNFKIDMFSNWTENVDWQNRDMVKHDLRVTNYVLQVMS